MINIKNKQQIDGIRLAAKAAKKCCYYLESVINDFSLNGMYSPLTTKVLDDLCMHYLKDNNLISASYGFTTNSGKQNPFSGYCCLSVNEEVTHAVPSERRIKEGDLVKIDVALYKNGFVGDTCITVGVGKLKDSRNKLLEFSRAITTLGCYCCRPGQSFETLSKCISANCKACGFAVNKATQGHGVGLKMHEDPSIGFDEDSHLLTLIQPGMIFTIEPHINEGSGLCVVEPDGWTLKTADLRDSAVHEEMVLILDKGFEILT